jgi:hypothetical protein
MLELEPVTGAVISKKRRRSYNSGLQVLVLVLNWRNYRRK